MLSRLFPTDSLTILPRHAWRPFPDITDRPSWEGLPHSPRRAWLARAESLAGRPLPALPATLYLEFARTGNRRRFEAPYFERRSALAGLLVAECLEDRGRFLDPIADSIWLIAEESSWCFPAHIAAQLSGPGLPEVTEPIVDLFAAETAAELAWVWYLLGERLDRVSPLIRPRIRHEVAGRVTDPFLERDDFWWMGFSDPQNRPNNWNPWINSNVLAAGLLLEEDERRRRAIVSKALRSLDRFLDPYPRDGGCDEGPGYWSRAGGSLFDCLETLFSVTAGQIDVWQEPLIREIGRFIARAQIAGEYFVNFADASAIVRPPAGVVYRYGRRTGDAELARLGAWLHRREETLRLEGVTSPERPLRELFSTTEMERAEAAQPLPRESWLPEIQVMTAREHAGSSAGLVLAAKGGHNGESHNHNDVGSFIVYNDGLPLVVDAGVGEYTRATFSPERYSIWTMQSSFHTLLPTVDGVMQAAGRAQAARAVSCVLAEDEAALELDLAGAYPDEAGIRSWQRRIALRRLEAVIVTDRYELARPAHEVVLSVLTPCDVSIESPAQILLREARMPQGRMSGHGRLAFSFEETGCAPEVAVERIDLGDPPLAEVWGGRLERVLVMLRDPPTRGTLRFRISGMP